MKSPFKFLDSYTKEDRGIFFGRDHEIEELYHRVFESKIMLVYGVSGTGKSSLIHCGLANKFQDTDWLPVVIRRGADIIESMSVSINNASTTKKSRLITPSDFKKGIRSLYLDHYKPVFFLFDQFEELFIFGNRNERKSFISIIKAISESEIQCRMIFIMREEYMAAASEFEKYIPTFFSNRVRIEKMSHANAVQAIKGPCEAFGIGVEEGFSEAFLEKLSPGSEDVELTYLQVFLDKIFRLSAETTNNESEKGHFKFTLSLLDKTGNVSDLLGSFLDEQISCLDNPEKGIAVLKSFVSIKGTKRQLTFEEVYENIKTLGQEVDEKLLPNILQVFVRRRILRDKDQNQKYELLHDSLASKIFEKITLVEKEILEVRQFIENAYSNYEKRRILLGADDLNYIAPYYEKLFIDKTLKDFVENSRKYINARRRAFTRTLIYSGLGFLVIIASIVIFYIRSNVKSETESLVLNSFLQRGFSPSLSFKTALLAYQKDSTSSVAIKGLFDSFYALVEGGPYYDSTGNKLDPKKSIFDFIPCESNIKYARFSMDGKYIYGFQENNTVNIWTINGQSVFAKSVDPEKIVALKFNPLNEYISAVFTDSTAKIWNINGDLVLGTGVDLDLHNPVDVISFSPDGNQATIIKVNNKINVFNLRNRTSYDLKGHKNKISSTVFSPDGRFIASASLDSSVIIWQYEPSKGMYEFAKRLGNYNNPVWSVDFAQNSKYILTISDSSNYPVLIKNLNGEAISFRYFVNNELKKDTAFIRKFPRDYYGHFYSAKFIKNDAAIRIMTFSDRLLSEDIVKGKYHDFTNGYDLCRIIYDPNVFQKTELNKYLKGYGDNLFPVDQLNRFKDSYSFVDLSDEYIAINIKGRQNSILLRKDRLPIRLFAGVQPNFSPDGNYLLCINEKKIELYPANELEITRLTVLQSIFGKLDPDLTAWRHFMKDF